MAVKPYPSNIIIFDIDDRVLDDDMKLALKRSWTHIGEILVRSHKGAQDAGPSNFIHVMVKFGTRKYLNSAAEDSDANWFERIEHHLLSTMRKISNNVIAFNRRQHKTEDPIISFDYIEFGLEGGVLTLEYRLDSNGSLPVSCADIATDIRTAINDGTLGDPVRVRIPSTRSYQEQVRAWTEAVETQATLEASLSAENDRSENRNDDDTWFVESPELVAEVIGEEEVEAEKNSPFEVAPLTEEEWQARYGVADPHFEIDYRIWEEIYADGTSQEYDSQVKQTKEFVA